MRSNVASHSLQLAREIDNLTYVRIVVVELFEVFAILKCAFNGDLRVVRNQLTDFRHTTKRHA